MKRYVRMAATMTICMLTLAGCSSEVTPQFGDADVIVLEEEGAVYSHLISAFDKDYYDVEELKDMAVKDAAAYNGANQKDTEVLLSVEGVEMLGGNRIKLTHKYSGPDVYEDYNGREFFYGTVAEAVEEGYNLEGLLTDVKNGSPIAHEDIMKKPEKKKILITDVRAHIYCPDKITHVSDYVIYREDGSVDTTQAEGTVVILMK